MITRHHPRDLMALKTHFGTLVHRIGGFDAAEAALRYRKGHLSAAASVEHPDRSPRADHIAELELMTGEPLITAALAGLAGYELQRRGTGAGTAEASMLGLVAQAGETMRQVAEALADSAICEAERVALLAQLDRLGRSLALARAGLAVACPR